MFFKTIIFFISFKIKTNFLNPWEKGKIYSRQNVRKTIGNMLFWSDSNMKSFRENSKVLLHKKRRMKIVKKKT